MYFHASLTQIPHTQDEQTKIKWQCEIGKQYKDFHCRVSYRVKNPTATVRLLYTTRKFSNKRVKQQTLQPKHFTMVLD